LTYAIVVGVALLLGYLAGLLSFRAKSRWCGQCGAVKVCPRCAAWASSAVLPDPSGAPARGSRRD